MNPELSVVMRIIPNDIMDVIYLQIGPMNMVAIWANGYAHYAGREMRTSAHGQGSEAALLLEQQSKQHPPSMTALEVTGIRDADEYEVLDEEAVTDTEIGTRAGDRRNGQRAQRQQLQRITRPGVRMQMGHIHQ